MGGRTDFIRGSADELTGDFHAVPKYNYRYEVRDPTYLNYHSAQESRDGDVVTGSYQVLHPNGELVTVDYVADKDGFRPTIRSEANGLQAVFGLSGQPQG